MAANTIPYLGKETVFQKQRLAMFFIKKITSTLHGFNRNITMDNRLTPVSLAGEPLKSPYNLSLVGTLKILKTSKLRATGTSMLCYNDDKTLLSYKAKSNTVVFVLSTVHDKLIHRKTDMIHVCNSKEGAVDTGSNTFQYVC